MNAIGRLLSRYGVDYIALALSVAAGVAVWMADRYITSPTNDQHVAGTVLISLYILVLASSVRSSRQLAQGVDDLQELRSELENRYLLHSKIDKLEEVLRKADGCDAMTKHIFRGAVEQAIQGFEIDQDSTISFRGQNLALRSYRNFWEALNRDAYMTGGILTACMTHSSSINIWSEEYQRVNRAQRHFVTANNGFAFRIFIDRTDGNNLDDYLAAMARMEENRILCAYVQVKQIDPPDEYLIEDFCIVSVFNFTAEWVLNPNATISRFRFSSSKPLYDKMTDRWDFFLQRVEQYDYRLTSSELARAPKLEAYRKKFLAGVRQSGQQL